MKTLFFILISNISFSQDKVYFEIQDQVSKYPISDALIEISTMDGEIIDTLQLSAWGIGYKRLDNSRVYKLRFLTEHYINTEAILPKECTTIKLKPSAVYD